MRPPPSSTRFPYTTLFRSARSVESKTFGAHECAEIGAFRHRILPGLVLRPAVVGARAELVGVALALVGLHRLAPAVVGRDLDRKSTRLNSSHTVNSYAVFC